MNKHDYDLIQNTCKRESIDMEKIESYCLVYPAALFAIAFIDNPAALSACQGFCNVMSKADDEGCSEVNSYLTDVFNVFYKVYTAQKYDTNLATTCKSPAEYAMRLMQCLFSEEPKTITTRISINGDKVDKDLLVSEGILASYAIIKKLRTVSSTINSKQGAGVMFGHLIPQMNIVLSLDDMNIRGMQVCYAADYVDGDIQRLCKLVTHRNSDMIEYVNKCTAENFVPGNFEKPLFVAVDSGASATGDRIVFSNRRPTEFIMDVTAAERFKSSNVTRSVIDYASMDIFRGSCTLDVAIKIAEAHGFELISDIPRDNRFSEETHHIIMFNNKTGDFLEAVSALEDNFTYGGARIIAARNGAVQRAYMSGVQGVQGNTQSFEHNKHWHLYVCDYNEGMFEQYQYLPDVDITSIPWNDYPVKGMVALPYPHTVDVNCMFGITRKLPEDLSQYIGIFHHEEYTIPDWVNIMCAANKVKNHVKPEYHKYFDSVLSDKYKAFARAAYLTIKGADKIAEFFRMTACIVNLSNDEIEKYKQACIDYLIEDLNRFKVDGLDIEWKKSEYSGRVNKVQKLNELDFTPDALDRFVLSYADGLNISCPDVSELPQEAIKWCRENFKYSAEESDLYLYSEMRNEYQHYMFKQSGKTQLQL